MAGARASTRASLAQATLSTPSPTAANDAARHAVLVIARRAMCRFPLLKSFRKCTGRHSKSHHVDPAGRMVLVVVVGPAAFGGIGVRKTAQGELKRAHLARERQRLSLA